VFTKTPVQVDNATFCGDGHRQKVKNVIKNALKQAVSSKEFYYFA